MYLSKLELPWNFVRNTYDIHRHLWKAFPGRPDDNRPFLYRLNWRDRGQPVEVLMQSSIEPVSPSDRTFQILGCRTFNPSPSKGQVLRFALCANPVKKLRKMTGETESQERVPLIGEEDRLGWLERQLGANDAAEILEAQIVNARDLYFRNGKFVGKHTTVTFSGYLEVKNSDSLIELVKKGIGPAKSFGCGLLTLARS